MFRSPHSRSRAPLLLAAVLLFAACQKEVEIPEPDPEPTPTSDNARGDNMALGNPSGAIANVVAANNYLIVHPQFTAGYDNSRGQARWVSWHLSAAWKGSAERCDCFEPDPLLPASFYAVSTFAYSGTGFDRGHLCPSDDRDASDADNASTFLLTNIAPQAPDMNQDTWFQLEAFARDLVADGYEIYTMAGGYGNGGTNAQGVFTTHLAGGAIAVPARYWKVLVIIPDDSNDVERITTEGARVIAVDMPNSASATAQPWYAYRTTVDAVEQSTGLDLLNALPTAVQEALEEEEDAGVVW